MVDVTATAPPFWVNNGDVRRSFIIRIICHGSVKCRIVVSLTVVDFGSGVFCPFLEFSDIKFLAS